MRSGTRCKRAPAGGNLLLFVSGFDLPKHDKLLTCTGVDFVARKLFVKLVPVFGWVDLCEDLVQAGYVAANNIPFIQNLKETVIPEKCQESDTYTSNLTVLHKDIGNYWGDMDDQFAYQIGSATTLYALGDNSIRTALTNVGYDARFNDGQSAAQDMITKIRNGQIKFNKETKIDIVAHSMGFAYAMGMVKSLKNAGYKIGWIYAIAPENAGAGYVPAGIEGIWQYGSQETDPFAKQDGIAPQKPIPGIKPDQRVPIDASAPQNFLQSHMIENYKWIFLRKETTKDLGYVKSRK